MTRFASIAVLAILGAACDTSEPTEVALEQYQQVQTSKDLAYEVRLEFVKDMRAELATIDRAVQQLADKVESGSSEAKADARAKLATLRERIAALNVELDRARSTPEAVWGEVEASFEKSQKELKASVAQARIWLSEKIAP
jgi:hypothetical protein